MWDRIPEFFILEKNTQETDIFGGSLLSFLFLINEPQHVISNNVAFLHE